MERNDKEWKIQTEVRLGRIEELLAEQQKDIRCIVRSWDKYQEKYQPTVDQIIDDRARWAELRGAAQKKLVEAGVISAVGVLLYALWEYVLRRMQGGAT